MLCVCILVFSIDFLHLKVTETTLKIATPVFPKIKENNFRLDSEYLFYPSNFRGHAKSIPNPNQDLSQAFAFVYLCNTKRRCNCVSKTRAQGTGSLSKWRGKRKPKVEEGLLKREPKAEERLLKREIQRERPLEAERRAVQTAGGGMRRSFGRGQSW